MVNLNLQGTDIEVLLDFYKEKLRSQEILVECLTKTNCDLVQTKKELMDNYERLQKEYRELEDKYELATVMNKSANKKK